MKQIIPFTKEIVFKSNIACITSISLEHEEKISSNEINGEFTIYGEYKEHNDTTERIDFKYNLPFTALIPDNIDEQTVKIDIEDFTYDNIEPDVIKVNIDFSIEGEEQREQELEEYNFDDLKNIFNNEEQRDNEINNTIIDSDPIIENNITNINIEEPEEIKEEPIIEVNSNDYVTYHIHIVKENETLEDIIKKYETTIDNIKDYNDISNININDKIIIPDYKNE